MNIVWAQVGGKLNVDDLFIFCNTRSSSIKSNVICEAVPKILIIVSHKSNGRNYIAISGFVDYS